MEALGREIGPESALDQAIQNVFKDTYRTVVQPEVSWKPASHIPTAGQCSQWPCIASRCMALTHS